MDKIIVINFKTARFETLTKFFFHRIYKSSLSNRTRDMARNTPAVLHASVSSCRWNCVGPMVASQLRQCQPGLTLGHLTALTHFQLALEGVIPIEVDDFQNVWSAVFAITK